MVNNLQQQLLFDWRYKGFSTIELLSEEECDELNEELEKLYGEKIPVTQIDGTHHDFWRVDPERFRSSLEKHRQRQ